jgi:hypothetical protein
MVFQAIVALKLSLLAGNTRLTKNAATAQFCGLPAVEAVEAWIRVCL